MSLSQLHGTSTTFVWEINPPKETDPPPSTCISMHQRNDLHLAYLLPFKTKRILHSPIDTNLRTYWQPVHGRTGPAKVHVSPFPATLPLLVSSLALLRDVRLLRMNSSTGIKVQQ